MDVVGTSIAFIANAITVIKFVRRTLKDIKDAPEQLHALLGRAADIERLLEELQRIQLEGRLHDQEDQDMLERCNQATTRCLDSIDKFTKQVQKVNTGGRRVVAKVPWLRKGDKLGRFITELNELRDALASFMHLATM